MVYYGLGLPSESNWLIPHQGWDDFEPEVYAVVFTDGGVVSAQNYVVQEDR